LGAPIEHEIKYLPGWSPRALPSKQYSGFVNANEDGSLKMHYWFVEAEYNASTSPLLLWFNGGPGASSLFGLLVELGPFLLNDISRQSPLYEETGIPQLIYNEYGWQKAANILALSMPPPIGFSYCDPPGPSATGHDCGAWNDTSTAQVTYHAIKSWYSLFPEYKTNDMYIAGESYAGVYVPMIVKEVLAHPEDTMNLQGFAVGDACTPPDICGSKITGPYWNIEFLYGKSAFSNRLYEEINEVCSQQELIEGGLSDACYAKVNQINDEVGGYWIYGYYDDCWYENDIRRRLLSPLSEDGRRYYGPPIIPSVKQGDENHRMSIAGPSPYNKINGYACGGPGAQIEWLGRPEVISALNLPADVSFFQSDNGVGFTYELTEDDLISWYKDIISQNRLRILVYNGDTDPCINAFQAQNWTRNLGFKEAESWRPWTLDGCQRMGGYVTRYENNFDFLTIKGSGHMVPQNKGRAALSFLKTFLQNDEYLAYDSHCSQPPANGLESMDHGPPIDLMTEDQILAELAYEKEQYTKKMNYLEKKLRELEVN
jgi:serine carboxypeptidase-like clade I